MRMQFRQAFCLAFFSAVLFFTSPLSYAETPLTSERIEQWIGISPKLHSFSQENKAKIDPYVPSQEEMMGDIAANFEAGRMLQPLKDAGLYGEAEEIVVDGGYDSLADWAADTAQIAKAYFALEGGEDAIAAKKEMQAEVQAMMSDPSIPAEMKQMIQQGMSAAEGMVDMITSVSEEDKAALEPYRAQVQRVFEESN